MKAQQRVNQGGLAGAVRTKQTDCASTQLTTQVLQDLAPPKANAQTIKINDRCLDQRLRSDLLIFFEGCYQLIPFLVTGMLP